MRVGLVVVGLVRVVNIAGAVSGVEGAGKAPCRKGRDGRICAGDIKVTAVTQEIQERRVKSMV